MNGIERCSLVAVKSSVQGRPEQWLIVGKQREWVWWSSVAGDQVRQGTGYCSPGSWGGCRVVVEVERYKWDATTGPTLARQYCHHHSTVKHTLTYHSQQSSCWETRFECNYSRILLCQTSHKPTASEKMLKWWVIVHKITMGHWKVRHKAIMLPGVEDVMKLNIRLSSILSTPAS